MNRHIKFNLLLGLVCIYLSPFVCDAAEKPVQLLAKMTYSRVGGYTRNDKDENSTSQFNYQISAQVEQIMLQQDPEAGEKYPSFRIINEDKPSFRNSGNAHLTASIDSLNKASGRHDTAQVDLTGTPKIWEDFHIKNFASSLPLTDFLAETESNLVMHGSVKSTFIQMPNTPKESIVYMWPLPVQYQEDEKQFVSNISGYLYTPLLPKPKDKQLAMLYDLTMGTINFADNAPTVGGAVLASDKGTLTSVNGGWIFNAKLSRNLTTPDGTTYVETFSMDITTVPITLPIPKEE